MRRWTADAAILLIETDYVLGTYKNFLIGKVITNYKLYIIYLLLTTIKSAATREKK